MSSAPDTRPRRGLPIRWRLSLISASLTFAILCIFAFAIGDLTTTRIRSDFNGQLATAADALAGQTEIQVDPLTNQIVRLIVPRLDDVATVEHAAIRVVSPTGYILRESKDAPPLPVGFGGSSFDALGYRVVQRTLNVRGSPSPAYIQYARKISDNEATVARVRTFLVVGVLGGTLAALLAGAWLARRAMRPIDRLTTAAREIAETRDPSQQIPLPRADDEIAELARTLDDMLQGLESSREETEAALSRQRQFVADASHELRTPLTSVLVNLELLADVLDGDRGEAARSALRSSRRMRRLVQDLLLLARADALRQLPHSPTDLSRVLVEAVAELEPVAGEHRLSVDAPSRAYVNGAQDDLHRLILNLVENAMRHTPPGTSVRATISLEGRDVVLTVEDDGPGIPEDMRDAIFERFVRAEGERAGSSGLGLAIVRAVADSHDGTVTVQDARPGAHFVVRLPAVSGPKSLLDDPVVGSHRAKRAD